jgi:hypothetical protein
MQTNIQVRRRKMEESNIQPEPQEEQTEQDAELQTWVTPTFERVALQDAQFTSGGGADGSGYSGTGS